MQYFYVREPRYATSTCVAGLIKETANPCEDGDEPSLICEYLVSAHDQQIPFYFFAYNRLQLRIKTMGSVCGHIALTVHVDRHPGACLTCLRVTLMCLCPFLKLLMMRYDSFTPVTHCC